MPLESCMQLFEYKVVWGPEILLMGMVMKFRFQISFVLRITKLIFVPARTWYCVESYLKTRKSSNVE